ncbi:type II toxin-antitoxin system VapC family toxin [Cellulosimicrobium sp. XJ-DQ-B-000]|uniref:type II toxin-antitoxin system VapC family toxin n=1 Tax=Cellulosimicrobium sp. XJ-DQ-B-000 TaxID=3072182 RepID=UPI0028078D13|nr:type II toxin-antitoxin system VapC family toxin [Cellulosimicrobium sp. XJ-DQ-B-000]MDQ8042296.1 type II toxin-antitoxin system VapC family toxin [Cellulosimicrobium sp. XJ-DQ-B-000]
MRYLLDTNVVSELVRTRPDEQVVTWLRGLRTHQIYLSVLTVGEIRTGVQRLVPRDAARATALETWVHGLEETYGDRILPVTLEIAQRWPAVHAARPLPVVDSLLAATALAHGLTVATRNTRAFVDSGVPVVNPFSSP